jgi:aminoglycoside phosphotransferase family enzyme/predicted kinase
MATAFEASNLIEGLLHPAAYTHEVGRIELVETHISWVFLTGDYAYKVKKPVNLGFLDFTTLDMRQHYCEEELRLNRQWAPCIYLDVVPIVLARGKPVIAGTGTPIDYAVRMRQFDQAMRLDRQLEAGNLGVNDILELAEEIARRHLQARRVPSDERLLRATRDLIRDNYEALAGRAPEAFLASQRRWMDGMLGRYDGLIRKRCAGGFFRECHGDLHLANLVRLPEGIRAFDCIEFDDALREIDVVCDYAFLAMDLMARDARRLASIFLNRYLEITGDYEGASLLPVYAVYRSLVRAKILGIGRHENEPGDHRALKRYCALARALIRVRQPILVAMTGYSGSGKSWLSSRLIPEIPAIRLRSDLERKRRAGLEPMADTHSGIETGLYDKVTSDAVYNGLLGTAGMLLRAGLNVIIDASFLHAPHRNRARQTAQESGAEFALVETAASEPELRDRLLKRGGAPDVSEADLGVLAHQMVTADPLTEAERDGLIIVNTDNEIDIAGVTRRILDLRHSEQRRSAGENAVLHQF